MYGNTISYSKPILNQHPYFWISKGQQTSIFNGRPFAAHWLLRQVHCCSLQVHRNIMIVTVCLFQRVVTTQEFDSTQICASLTPPPLLETPTRSASLHWDYWSHLQAYYMVLSVWHAPKILIRARALNAWSKESQAAHSVFKLHIMQSWLYAGLVIDAWSLQWCHAQPVLVNIGRRCLATQAHAPALWGGVTVFTGLDLATVMYAKHSRVQSKLHFCWK